MSQSTPPSSASLWAIVLAAGEGTRLAALTRALHGEDLPKQFATIHRRRSMLQTTLRRTARFSSIERTVVVVSTEREELARSQIGQLRGIDVVAQPKNVGTGPGLLLPLSRVAARDPNATVVVLPSDHYVRDEKPFVESIRRAESLALQEDAVVLVAAVPSGPETQYGWIVTDPDERRSVAGFVEKPSATIANELFRAGALWSTFILVGPAHRLLALARERMPEQSALFDEYRAALGTAGERETLARVYESMAAADFSRDVLGRSEGLRVAPLLPCGWSDWGTPDRVFESLRGTGEYDAFLERLRASRTTSEALLTTFQRNVASGANGPTPSSSNGALPQGLVTTEAFS